MNKVLITGGAGFIGSNLSRYLLDEGFEVHILDDFSAGREEYVPKEVVVHRGDVRDKKLLEEIMAGVQYVFHLAARPRVQDSIDHPIETTEVNMSGLLYVLEAARKAGVKRVVFASSSAVYGDLETMPLEETMSTKPVSPYGLHKLAGEHFCRLYSHIHGLETVSLRYFNVYGPNCDPHGSYPLVVSAFLERRRQGKNLVVFGDGSNTRDYVHAMDIARANLLAATSKSVGGGEVLNIGAGIENSVSDIAVMVGGSVEYKEPRIEPKRVVADANRAHALLGWKPSISLEEGIQMLKQQTQ